MTNNICGKYRHFKGNKYEVYCEVKDKYDNKFVLYQQLYGDKSFWVRPYDMFFENVETTDDSGKPITVKRFDIIGKVKSLNDSIKKLLELVRADKVTIRNTENEAEYIITNLSTENNKVIVQPFYCDYQIGGYVTSYELFRRMNKTSCIINDKLEIWDRKRKINTNKELIIHGYDNEKLRELVNPCSIDLHIADTGFIKTRHKRVDPESIEHASNSKELWKKARVHKSKKGGDDYICLWPGQTVLTRIANRIKLPKDCAGKIEIKSTYARLSLSITSGDFCNPGYDGFFPLEITNHGNHVMIIHGNTVMAQLMLIASPGPFLEEYSQRASQINSEGFDDGLPYKFWTEHSIKKLRKKDGGESLIALYNALKAQITPGSVDDINAYKTRFDDTFLTYCQNVMYRDKFKNQHNDLPDIEKILKNYIDNEKRLKLIYSIRIIGIVLTIIGAMKTILDICEKINPGSISIIIKSKLINQIIGLLFNPISIPIYILIAVLLTIKKPKAFCTFEKIDIEKPLDEIRNN